MIPRLRNTGDQILISLNPIERLRRRAPIDLFNKITCMRRVTSIDLFSGESSTEDQYRTNRAKMPKLSKEVAIDVIGCIYRDRVGRTTHPPLSICSGEKGWGGKS